MRKAQRSVGAPPAVARACPELAQGASRPRISEQSNSPNPSNARRSIRMFLIPCSCGTTFAVAENYDRQGTAWSRYLICPGCGKRHDPKNRLLQLGFHPEGYWKVDDC
jgi:hypothetical protein